jgi:excisionase family DNA binding protein
MEKLLKIKEVAELLQVKESTIRAWVFRKKIPFKKIHNNIRFKPKEIDDFIEGRWKKTPL